MKTELRQVRELVADLVSIDSVNPDLVPGAAGEAKVARYIAEWLEKAGVAVQIDEPCPGRVSVIGKVGGSGGGKTLLLNGHIDTVTVAGMTDPHIPKIEGDRLYGHGAYDMKGGVAAAMLTLAAYARNPKRGNLILAAVCDEEYASLGTTSLLKQLRADAAIVTESTGLDIVTAHKGFAWFDIETSGVAAHGSRPDLGVDAILAMGKVLGKLDLLNQSLETRPKHPLLGHSSLHASLVQGGQELSSYPSKCRLSIERRTIPDETVETVRQEIQSILDELSAVDANFRAELKAGLWREPFEVGDGEVIVKILEASAERHLGRSPAIAGLGPWMDAALLSAANIPTVIFGPGGGGAHAIDEWVSLNDVLACHEILLSAAQNFCS